ncbi:MAG: cytosine deaminase related metal-dependent hydrolase [Haloquadratum walsbyi J07HQW1]|jgi:cytosine deaminase|uniref:Cytosine deaminase related metal-dependent hydrolase n=1 Tax=Haloquadratum walsbyi J07HQW1 TaxID=1238424 RepID=U1PD73_9EURY|nr:MAG: cytosine deaminase related metal-dependent hydrolase [Haloquadratum walsbyi J07HQW1]
MHTHDYILTNGRTLSGDTVDIEIRSGIIDRIVPAGEGDPGDFDSDRQHDANRRLVTPPLIEPHLHLDATQTAGDPSWNESGTLTEGIEIWDGYKKDISVSDIVDRATRTVEWYVAHGVTRIRTHADVTESSLTTIEALVELRNQLSDIVDIQIVAFPQDGVFTNYDHEALLRESAEMGVDLIGAIPHAEHTREDGVASINLACDLAESFDMGLDLHIDETDDPGSRFTEVLASEAMKRDIGQKTVASHATALHSYPNSYAEKVISLLAESDVSVITNPPDNSVLQGSYDDYPRRRGHTRIDELQEAGVTVGIGHDSVLDPWYHYGVADPLDAAFILVHYAHMAGREDVETLWQMLTEANADVLGIEGYGLQEGTRGSLVVFDAPDGFNALRQQPARTLVVNAGKPVAETEPANSHVYRENGTQSVSFNYE